MEGVTNAQGLTWPDLTETIQRMQNNPPVGSLTSFVGNDWLAVRWDTTSKRIYLASKHILWECDNTQSFQAVLSEYDSLLSGLPYISRALEDVSDFLPEGAVSGGHYVFIPTFRQIFDEFPFFWRFPNGIATLSNSSPSSFIGKPWCLAPEATDESDTWVAVGPHGDFTASNFVELWFRNNYPVGVRPFICMKMR